MLTRPHSRYPSTHWTDDVSFTALDLTLHSDLPLTPAPQPAHVPGPARVAGMCDHPHPA